MVKQHPNFEKFVRSFVSDDHWRDSICRPIVYDSGWVASTNSHKLLWFHDPEFINRGNVHIYSEGNGANAEKIMTEYSKFYEGGVAPFGHIKVSDLEKIYEDIKMIPEYDKKYKTCDECDGDGEIECDCCGHSKECDECDGDGEIECGEEETGYYIYPKNHHIKIHGCHLSLGEMKEIVDYVKLVGVEELLVYATDSDIKTFFGIPNSGMFILIMGLFQDNNENYTLYDVKIHNNQ
jgi:hypothetical protein